MTWILKDMNFEGNENVITDPLIFVFGMNWNRKVISNYIPKVSRYLIPVTYTPQKNSSPLFPTVALDS